MTSRPKLKVQFSKWDYLIETISLIIILMTIAWPITYMGDLPEEVPRHYNALGEPDAFSDKSTLWILMAVSVASYTGLTILNRFPHLFNYPTEITETNAEKQYRMGTQLVRSLKMIITASFFYILFTTIEIGLNRQSALGGWFLPIFLLAVFGVIGIYIIFGTRKSSK